VVRGGGLLRSILLGGARLLHRTVRVASVSTAWTVGIEFFSWVDPKPLDERSSIGRWFRACLTDPVTLIISVVSRVMGRVCELAEPVNGLARKKFDFEIFI
jgi:hypothetical protein